MVEMQKLYDISYVISVYYALRYWNLAAWIGA
jgi:hypothetical protein